jgi:hypothetical protein
MENGTIVKNARYETLPKRILKGYGFLLLSQVLCFFVNLSFTALATNMGFLIVKIFFCFCTLCITLGLMFNWAMNAAKNDLTLEKHRGKAHDPHMALKLGIGIAIIPMVLFILLICSKAGLIGNFLPIFSITFTWIIPFKAIFTTSAEIADITIAGMFGLGFLTLLIPAAAIGTYTGVVRGFDMSKIIYNKKN